MFISNFNNKDKSMENPFFSKRIVTTIVTAQLNIQQMRIPVVKCFGIAIVFSHEKEIKVIIVKIERL